MTITDIKKLIANDESRVLELKKSTGELVKGMQTLCACKAAGVPEPTYGTDGLFVWITFKRPDLDTYLETYSDTYSDTNTPLNGTDKCNTSHNQHINSDTYSDTDLDTNSDSNLDTNLVTDLNTNPDCRLLLSDRQKEVLRYCIFPRSSREILEHINVSYQNKNIVKFIKYLVDAGLLDRTQPDSPNAPNQKYVIKRK